MTGTFETPKLKPIGVVQMFQALYKERLGVAINLLSPGAKGRNLNGAKLILQACDGDPRAVQGVLSQFFASDSWGVEHNPNLSYVASQVPKLQAQVQRLKILNDSEREAYVRGRPDSEDRSAYVRSMGQSVDAFAGWEI